MGAPALGPLSGLIQKTAPLSAKSEDESVQVAKSMPMEESAPAESPATMPTVSHESTAAVGTAEMNAWATPPVLAPNGVASWYAAGAVSDVTASPKMV